MSDEHVPNEPVATGWLTTLLGGDVDLAKTYIRTARGLLGQLRITYGVNDRIAAGEEAGFYKATRRLDDGSVIEVFTNNGQDTIKIITPRAAKDEAAVSEALGRHDEHETRAAGRGVPVSHKDVPVPVTELVARRDEDEDEEEEKKEDAPYLWVGLRSRYDVASIPYYGAVSMMIEPDTGLYRGIVGQQFGVGGWVEDHSVMFDRDTWDVPDVSALPSDLGQWLSAFHNTWAASSVTGQLGRKEYKDHNFSMGAAGSRKGVFFSANGLIYTDNQYWGAEAAEVDRDWTPYDPLLSPEENAASTTRAFGGRVEDVSVSPGKPPALDTPWDMVYVIDPNDFDMIEPYDPRPQMLAMTSLLRGLGVAQGEAQVLDGVYTLVVFGFANDVPQSSRNDPITTTPPDLPPAPYRFRHGDGDYAEYMAPQAYDPLQVEVEIRIGKGDSPAVFNFELSTEFYAYSDYSQLVPFGLGDTYDECSNSGGPNPASSCYSALIGIDVANKDAWLGAEWPPRVFGARPWRPPEGAYRSPVDVYVYGDIFPAVADADWSAEAGTAVFQALEAMTSGVYGINEMNEQSEGDVQAAFGGTGKSHVWKYDCTTNTVTDMGAPTGTSADWAAYDPPLDSTYFFWYYPHAIASRNDCRHVMGVLISSVGAFFDTTSTFLGYPGFDDPDCC